MPTDIRGLDPCIYLHAQVLVSAITFTGLKSYYLLLLLNHWDISPQSTMGEHLSPQLADSA